MTDKKSDTVFLTRVELKNYKSIAECSVEPGPLTFLVGRNGAGKSNFLDALRLVTESLTTSLDHALRDRGGIKEVRRRSSGHPTNFSISLECRLRDGQAGRYSFVVGAVEKGGFEVVSEECQVWREEETTPEGAYRVDRGEITSHQQKVMPPASRDRLYLVAAVGLPVFRPVFDSLSRMGFYNLNPDTIRELQSPDLGEVLRRDGGNLASVLGYMKAENSDTHQRLQEFLSKVVPGIEGVSMKHVGKKETLEFLQKVGKNEAPWRFMAENMSDGTLRAFGVLTALFQGVGDSRRRIPLVGIEEPESAVHPGAAGVLRDALRTAAASTQVLVTSHSPDLLDDKSIRDQWILGVENVNGETRIGPLMKADREVIREGLFTVGELLRQGQLAPDLSRPKRRKKPRADLFGSVVA